MKHSNAFIIYNFDIGGDKLKSEHKDFLRDKVVTPLRSGLQLGLLGRADRRGKVDENYDLGMRRGFSTLAFFRKEVTTGFWAKVRSMDTGGDMGSWKAPYHEDDRCVWVMLFPAGRFSSKSD